MIVGLEIMCLAFFHVVAIITNLSTLRVQRYNYFSTQQEKVSCHVKKKL